MLDAQVFPNPWRLGKRSFKEVLETMIGGIVANQSNIAKQGLTSIDDQVAIVLLDPTRSPTVASKLAEFVSENCRSAWIEEAYREAGVHRRFGQPRTLLPIIQQTADEQLLTDSASAERDGLVVGVKGLATKDGNQMMADYVAIKASTELRSIFIST